MSGAMPGSRIRALRKRLGLSQVAFAARLGVSNVTVNRWEHDRARPHPAMIERLLSMEGEERPEPRGAGHGRNDNLPATFTTLIEREEDIAALSDIIATRPLVTITGPAGVGKTRLAIETGRTLARNWPDGVWFVDLAATIEPDDVPQAVARVLGVRAAGRGPIEERLADAFGNRNLLLILDNCEHLLAAAARLAEHLCAAGSGSRLLATSRVPLAIAGEVRYALRPLSAAGAAALFLQHVRDHLPDLAPDSRQLHAIDEICHRLDRLPLPVELAAARARILSIEQIAGRLDNRFDLLHTSDPIPPRQQALATAIAWSYDLLDEAEAALFRRLGVFVGWFDLPAVEAISGSDSALDLLESLARQSMIVVEHDPAVRSARYRLLESLAEYARAALEAHGEAEDAARLHAGYYSALTRRSTPGLRGAEQARLLALLDRQYDNILAALEWRLAAGEAEEAIVLAAALGPYWRLRGLYAAGIAWLARALALEQVRLGPERPAALHQLGLLHYHTGRFEDAKRALDEALALARERDDRHQEAQALDALGLVLVGLLDLDRGGEAHAAALQRFLTLGDRAGAARSRHYLGNLANLRGDRDAAERAYREAWVLVQGTEDKATEALILSNLGEVAARGKRYRRALGYYEQALVRLRALGDPDRIAVVGVNLAEVRLILGDAEAGLALAESATAQFRSVGNPAHVAATLYVQAAALAALGQRTAALDLLRESLDLYHQLGDWIDVVYVVEAIARLLADGEDAWYAARMLGGADALREREQVADYPLFDYAGTVEAVRASLGEAVLAARWAEGRALSPVELVAEAMLVGSVDDGNAAHLLVTQQSPRRAARDAGALTARQTAVLRLVAEGKSNREIGRALGISERTVERHLTAIFGALDVDRRSAAVARATALGLLAGGQD